MGGSGAAQRGLEPRKLGGEDIVDARHLPLQLTPRKVAVGQHPAVGQHIHEQLLAADIALADDFALVPHVFEDAVTRAVERFVVERRHPRAECSVPRAGKIAPGLVAAQRMGAVRRHFDMVGLATRTDAARHCERADESVLLRRRPAVVPVPRGGRQKIEGVVARRWGCGGGGGVSSRGGSGGEGGGRHQAVLSTQPTSL